MCLGALAVTYFLKTVAELAKISNIVAIKEASGNLDQVSEISRLCPTEFEIYSGDDSLTLPMLSVGAVGVVSVGEPSRWGSITKKWFKPTRLAR